jgi:hypothetical protein
LEDIKLVKITERNPRGVKQKDGPKNRWKDEIDMKKLKPRY